jgi:valyl-tRNA synthetase
MALSKRYNPKEVEPRLLARWEDAGVHRFPSRDTGAVFSIDTPPPTVSGSLHMGHVYSYSHPDFLARFARMNGYRVFYPMGYDDNGLPTDRLVEKRLGITARQVGRSVYIRKCLQVSEEAEKEYETIWKRLGLSVDWRYTYRTIDARSRKTFQLSFLRLHEKGLTYRSDAPAIWCPECQTAIAQAELNDLDRSSEFITLEFQLKDGSALPVATTRPELLPACVAVFVNPTDSRYAGLVGQQARVPLFGREVPILSDSLADPLKGTGAVMCCTFGDATDVAWWHTYGLPLIAAVGKDGRLTAEAGDFAGLKIEEAHRLISKKLEDRGLVLNRQPTSQSVRVHERCDTPVEYVIASQWFIRLLDYKDQLISAGEKVIWIPRQMQARYRAWVENLNWDWCISRQRSYGVPFPLWYCKGCGEVLLASEETLPVDPIEIAPDQACSCGSTEFIPEQDVLDTWATSSLSPQIVGGWLDDPDLYAQVFPFSLRPQSHEIIRTWAFYTIAISMFHFDSLPWQQALISGWGVAGEGMGKISKSRGGGPMPPLDMINNYSADAVRYWSSATGPGKDAIISVEKIQTGQKLVTKIWNVARFAERFLAGYVPPDEPPALSPADRWILARIQRLIRRATTLLQEGDYAAARSEIESFFWRDLADNYLEMSKQRLYDPTSTLQDGARFTLYHVFMAVLKLFAPFFPFITEEVYQGLIFDVAAKIDAEFRSIHASSWPKADPVFEDQDAEKLGVYLVEIATAVRRYKSENSLPLGFELARLELAVSHKGLATGISEAAVDLSSVTRARQVSLVHDLSPELETITGDGTIRIAIELPRQSESLIDNQIR